MNSLWRRMLLVLLMAAVGQAHPMDDAALEIRLEQSQASLALTIPYALVATFDDDRDRLLSASEVAAHRPALLSLLEQHLQLDPPAELSIEASGSDVPLTTHVRMLATARWPTPPEGFSLRYSLWPLKAVGPRCLLVFERGDLSVSRVLTEQQPEFRLDSPWTSRALSFFLLGTEHIFTGYDHILFLICLLLPGGTLKSLVKTVTAFTLAHSLTLSLAVLDVVVLPARLVESAIALSIIVAALLNLRPAGSTRRWPLAMAFGLLHGLGFARILQDRGVTGAHAALPLVSFNLGVEAGQLVIVLMAFPALLWMHRQPWARRAVVGLSLVSAALAALWLVERLKA